MIVPKLRSPIVLVPGLLGYDQLKLCGWTLSRYFPDIPEYLQAAGNRVLVAKTSPTRGVAERAAELKEFISRELPGEQVHIFGHSMGGLDSRHMISCLDMASTVLSLTTLGTPHRGSSFADWGMHRLGRLLTPLFDMFCFPSQAFHDLTTVNCRAFNSRCPDMPNVRYFSVAGHFDGQWLSPQWRLAHRIVSKEEGDNDGVVSLASATYGESTEVWNVDHVGLVNWPNPSDQARGTWRDRTPYYGGLVRRLADEGF